MLTVARTLMGNPKLILIDEPTEGLAPLIVKDVLEMLAAVRNSGVTVLMVEQNFKASIKVADRFYIMGKGQMVFEGNTEALLAAEEVRKNYPGSIGRRDRGRGCRDQAKTRGAGRSCTGLNRRQPGK